MTNLYFMLQNASILKVYQTSTNLSIFLLVALFTFCNGRYVGAILDRNGLRPSRFYVTKDNHMYMSSEVGVTDCKSSEVIQKVLIIIYIYLFVT